MASATTPRPSTVHRGAAFEARSMDVLRHDMSMTLKQVGGKDDGGIDFFGWWWVPHESPIEPHASLSLLQRRRIRVIGQCKAEKKKIGPHYIRELEGVLYRFLTQKSDHHQHSFLTLEDEDDMKTQLEPYAEIVSLNENSPPAIALLVSQSAFTKSTILRANSSPIPFCLLHLPPVDEQPTSSTENVIMDQQQQPSIEPSAGNLGSVWFNPALCGAKGFLKGRMEVRWERHSENVSARPALWWDGNRLSSWVPVSTTEATSPGIPVKRD